MSDVIGYLEHFDTRDNAEQKIKDYKKQIEKEKKRYQISKDNENANKYWVFLQTLKIQELFLLSYNKLKNGEFYHAWCSLERCEIEISSIVKHIQKEEMDNYWISYISKKTTDIQSLYPYKIFFSPEIIEKEKKCNICNQVVTPRNHCGHKVGNIYYGEYCIREVTKLEFLNIAIVDKPVQKYSVPFLKDEKNGKDIDHYNYTVVKYLIDGLTTPFDEWSVSKFDKLHPHTYFSDIGRNDKCPCNSNKKYKNCCLKKEGVLMPHFEFEFPSSTDIKHLGLKFV